jgi:cell division protein FtsB
MSAAGSYDSEHVDDSSAHRRRLPRDVPTNEGPEADLSPTPDGTAENARGSVDLAGLSVAGITKRRVAWVSAAFVAVWIVVVFARQVGDAQAAANRAVQLAHDNAALAAEVSALQKERDLIVEPNYVAQEARGHGLGSAKEIAFSLDPNVPPPVDGAPGSASVRLGATTDRQTPLESWLSILFGPTG